MYAEIIEIRVRRDTNHVYHWQVFYNGNLLGYSYASYSTSDEARIGGLEYMLGDDSNVAIELEPKDVLIV